MKQQRFFSLSVFGKQFGAIFEATGEACILYRAVKETITHGHPHLLFYWLNK